MNDNNLIITLQYINKIYRKKINIELNINPLEKLINRIKINKLIFSIDPINCNDIDDAISFEEYNDIYIIGIYIAQPIYYLSQQIIEERIQTAFSTLYSEPYEKNNNLWGNLITEKSSLLKDLERPVYSIIFYINKNLEIIKIENYPALIINNIQTNYDECLNYSIIKDFYNFTINLSKNSNLDTHQLISYWMIKTNNYIGQINNKIPKRVMKKIDILENKNIDEEIKEIFTNRICEKAYYSLTDNYHYNLDIFDYTHFTSPIRRIMDTIIHWYLTYNYFEIDIEKINLLDKQTQKYNNTIKLLNIIDDINDINDNELYGWIYKKSIDKNIWTVYFKQLGFQKVKIWDNKFSYLINDEIINKINNIKIGNKYLFKIYKKNGFLPQDKFLIIPSFIIL
jgi:hypothetical protein